MKEIQLTNGGTVLVDDEDFELVNGYQWYKAKPPHGKTWHARENRYTKKPLWMHRLIANPQPGQIVDHIDGDGLNNQRSNLRVCSPRQSVQNIGIRKNNTSGFTGVFQQKNGRWAGLIRTESKRVFLGTFATRNEAIKARVLAEIKYFGRFSPTTSRKLLIDFPSVASEFDVQVFLKQPPSEK